MSDKVEVKEIECVIVIGVEESYWLLSGEEYLSAMLSGEEYYPTPVIYYEYDSLYELNMDLEEGVTLNSLWGIHPGIIGRLRRDEHIKEERK
ncbi:MAG TPA: hypothetical protein EYG79_14000 [Rhodobacteraceae bacterium]|nr:hypothetical protein [Paracoccaceae bacterium]